MGLFGFMWVKGYVFSLIFFYLSLQVVKAELIDVKVEFGPIYWTHNLTLIPTTTTTTTTTTTSTTTEPTTTSTMEPKPALPPPFDDEDMDNEIANDQSVAGDSLKMRNMEEKTSKAGVNGSSDGSTINKISVIFASALSVLVSLIFV